MKRKMTGKILAVCAVLMLTGVMAGCGKEEGNVSGEQVQTESQSNENEAASQSTDYSKVERILLRDVDLDSYVTVGDYRNLRVERTGVVITDEELSEAVQETYIDSFPAELGVADRAVAVGDTANIDFEGKKDGVAFSGGTAQDFNLTIGSHSFIDGFEDGLVGVMPGETVDLNLRFPDSYGNSELAGQDVVFTVKVNYIIPAQIMEEAIPKLGLENVNTLEELQENVREELYAQKLETEEEDYEDEIFGAFMELCEFKELPQELLDNTKRTIQEALTSSAAQYGLDADTFVGYVYGVDLDTFLEFYAEPSLKQNMALYSVARQENLYLEGEELNNTILEYANMNGFDDIESYLEALDSDLDAFQEDYAITMAYDRLLEIAGQ